MMDGASVTMQYLASLARVGVVLAIGTASLLLLLGYLRRRIIPLAAVIECEEQHNAASTSDAHRVKRLSALAAALVWLRLLMWFVATTWPLQLFPQTSAIAGKPHSLSPPRRTPARSVFAQRLSCRRTPSASSPSSPGSRDSASAAHKAPARSTQAADTAYEPPQLAPQSNS